MVTEPFNQAKCVAELADGREIDVVIKNFGWQGDHYLTQWEFEGEVVASRFDSEYHQPSACPCPALRECRDMECLEEAILARIGVPMLDLVV